MPLESYNHILLEDEPAFRTFIEEMRAFLGEVAIAQPVSLSTA